MNGILWPARITRAGCTLATDMDARTLLSDAAEVAAFAKFLQRLCSGMRWSDVEPRARQAWAERSPLRDRLPWDCVRDFVRETWFLQ